MSKQVRKYEEEKPNGKERRGTKRNVQSKNRKAKKKDLSAHKVRDGRGDDSPANLSTEGMDNDPNWYFMDANVAEQAASFSFDQFIGVPTVLHQGSTKNGTNTFYELQNHIPSIMRVSVNPSVGVTSNNVWEEGINQAGLATYSTLSSVNAKTTSYGPQDVTLLICGLGQLVAVLEHIRRAFGVAFTYNARNREMPKRLIQAMGFNPDDFFDDIAAHRLEFNSWITSVNKLPFLSNIAYLHKCAEMYQKVYLDDESDMAQIVFTAPYSTWLVNETVSDQGGILATTALPQWGKTEAEGGPVGNWTEWRNVVTHAIRDLFSSATFNYIYADILNYSTKTGAQLMYMDYLVEGYTVVPEYNRTYLMQIHNSRAHGAPVIHDQHAALTGKYTSSNDVYPDVSLNALRYRPYWAVPEIEGMQLTPFVDAILDCDTDTPSLEDKIEFTRLTSLWIMDLSDGTEAGKVKIVPLALPDYYVVNYMIADGDTVTVIDNSTIYQIGATENDVGPNSTQTKIVSMLSQFDWAPFIYGISRVKGGQVKNKFTLYGDTSYFTTIDSEYLRRVNDLAFQSLFRLR